MPEVPEKPDRLPIAHTGQKRVHQHDAVDLGRVLGGVGVGHHQADVMADDRRLACARVMPRGRGRRSPSSSCRTRSLRLGRFAEAAQVGGDHRMCLRELGDERSPHVAGLCVAVQEQYGIAFPGDQIVQSGSVHLCEAAIDRDRLICHRGRDDRRRSDDACQAANERLSPQDSASPSPPPRGSRNSGAALRFLERLPESIRR